MLRRVDGFIVSIVAVATLAIVLPAQGSLLDALRTTSLLAVAVLFFLYGWRLSTAEVVAGLRVWRLHVVILAITFVVLPAVALLAKLLDASVLAPGLVAGVVLLGVVPSTVQSSISFTTTAGGNVAAAVVSASMSSMLGVFLTPLLVALLISDGATIDADAIAKIVLQLLLPFVLGQLARRFLGDGILRHKVLLKVVDRGTILLVVFVAFSAGTNQDVWQSLEPHEFAVVIVVVLALLAVALGVAVGAGRLLGFARPERIVILFCGSNKSLAAGLPMATILFDPDDVTLVVIPLMFYHLTQLIVCAWLARRMAVERA